MQTGLRQPTCSLNAQGLFIPGKSAERRAHSSTSESLGQTLAGARASLGLRTSECPGVTAHRTAACYQGSVQLSPSDAGIRTRSGDTQYYLLASCHFSPV